MPRAANLQRLLLLGAAAAPAVRAVRSFGRGYDARVCVGHASPIFQHTIADPRSMGVMDHFWTTGSSEEQQAEAGVHLMINYHFDGAEQPSLSFNPAMASGQFFGAVQLPANSSWADGTRAATSNLSMFAAGDKMGKNALTSAWFNYYKLPFARTVRVTSTLAPRNGEAPPKPGACVQLYCIVRGHEASSSQPPVVLPSGFALPPSARMVLQRTDVVAAPNAFVPLMNYTDGKQALIFKLGLGLTASPPWGVRNSKTKRLTTRNNYVEGCWHLLRDGNESLPGQVLGTGLEGEP